MLVGRLELMAVPNVNSDIQIFGELMSDTQTRPLGAQMSPYAKGPRVG